MHKTEHIVHVQTLKSITERSRHRSAAEKEWRVKKNIESAACQHQERT
jgi:hypothetical protein